MVVPRRVQLLHLSLAPTSPRTCASRGLAVCDSSHGGMAAARCGKRRRMPVSASHKLRQSLLIASEEGRQSALPHTSNLPESLITLAFSFLPTQMKGWPYHSKLLLLWKGDKTLAFLIHSPHKNHRLLFVEVQRVVLHGCCGNGYLPPGDK